MNPKPGYPACNCPVRWRRCWPWAVILWSKPLPVAELETLLRQGGMALYFGVD